MLILAIDPGAYESGFCVWNGEEILDFGKILNTDMLEYVATKNYDLCAIEKIESYGMAVGVTTFDTVFWTGRFYQVADEADKRVLRIPRKVVKLYLCGAVRAKDSNIIQAIKDRFEPNLERHERPKGLLKGLKRDCWQAFALAVLMYDTYEK